MSTEENKAIVIRLLEEGFNANNPAVFDEMLAGSFVNHDPAQAAVVDREGLKRHWAAVCAAFPDNRTVVEDLIAEGDRVVKRARWQGTHTGELQGIPPTGKQVALPSISIYRITGGKVGELWWGYDNLSLLQQLGVLPQPEPAAV